MVNHVFENLLNAQAKHPNRTALEFMGQQISFGALAQNARKLATGLKVHGVEPGASVGLMLPNIPHFAEALYGAWMNGNVVVPMNVLLTAPEIRYLVEDSKIQALFVFEMFLPQVEVAITGLHDAPRVIVIGNAGRHTAYTALVEGQAPVAPRSATPDEHILTIYTSGTTGKPKGAVITNHNVIAQLDMTDDLFPPQPGDKSLCVLPLFHVFALNGVLNSAIRHCETIVLHVKFELDAAVKSLQNDGITTFAGVPTMYFYILKHPDIATLEFPKLRMCVTGGAAMPVDVLHSFEDKFGVPIFEGYGLTETTVSVCCNRAGAKKAGSVGKPYPGLQLKIVDDEGRETKTGERGEIIVKGPNIMQGYLNRPEATAETIVDGWLHTGDIGYVDDEGFVFIVDRKKDMIIKGGYNIYPREIEEVLYQMPQVAEAAVVGVQDDAKGEHVRAVISVRPGTDLDEQQVETYLKENLAKYKLPSEYVFVNELPKGPTGKILKRELRN
jgi:long-chain acyl-CoA synthetase